MSDLEWVGAGDTLPVSVVSVRRAHFMSHPDTVFQLVVVSFVPEDLPLTRHRELHLGLGEDVQKDEDGIPREGGKEGVSLCGERIPAGVRTFI